MSREETDFTIMPLLFRVWDDDRKPWDALIWILLMFVVMWGQCKESNM